MRFKKIYIPITIIICLSFWILSLSSGDHDAVCRKTLQTHVNQSSLNKNTMEETITRTQLSTMPLRSDAKVPNASTATDAFDEADVIENGFRPSLFWVSNHLPHVKEVKHVYPRIKLSQNRLNATIVIGIPTIKRPSNDTYILQTVRNFFDCMTDKERENVIIVISISEPWNLEFEEYLLREVKSRFYKELKEGALEVIAPYPEFYPDLNTVQSRFGDSRQRVNWRSKQNLDYGFLMMYSLGRGPYYLQLEDDISTVKGFVSSIKNTVVKERGKHWISLSFSVLGYIGRLYHRSEVRGIMEYLMKHFGEKPCDWLQYDFIASSICSKDMNKTTCRHKIANYTWAIKPSLFQHDGLRSSLEGKINKLKDKNFAEGIKTSLYSNPKPAALLTSLEVYQQNTLLKAYDGKRSFWAKTPLNGDVIEILYDPPITISSIMVTSGQSNSRKDAIESAVIEILPAAVPAANSSLNGFNSVPALGAANDRSRLVEKDRMKHLPTLQSASAGSERRFYTIGAFSNMLAEVKVSPDVGSVHVIRVRFDADYTHWVVIDGILIV